MLKIKNANLKGDPQDGQRISFQVSDGEVVVLGGPSGRGKSSLAKQIAMVYETPNERGVVESGGSRPFLVMQNYEEVLSPAHNIIKGVRRVLSMDSRVRLKEALDGYKETAERLSISRVVLNKMPRQVSGGQMQRCLIALGLATGSNAVIFDETLAGLDLENKKRACALIEQNASDTGRSILVIGHDEYLHRRFRAVFVQPSAS